MNEADARATPTVHGYIGEYRLCWKADYATVSQWCTQARKMVPVYFKSKFAAETYAWREKHRKEQSIMLRGGDKISAAKSAAEKLFSKEGGRGMIWFAWERQPTGNWAPVCYHGDKPRKDADNRLTLHEVPADCIDADGSPNFGALTKRFPLPEAQG